MSFCVKDLELYISFTSFFVVAVAYWLMRGLMPICEFKHDIVSMCETWPFTSNAITTVTAVPLWLCRMSHKAYMTLKYLSLTPISTWLPEEFMHLSRNIFFPPPAFDNQYSSQLNKYDKHITLKFLSPNVSCCLSHSFWHCPLFRQKRLEFIIKCNMLGMSSEKRLHKKILHVNQFMGKVNAK